MAGRRQVPWVLPFPMPWGRGRGGWGGRRAVTLSPLHFVVRGTSADRASRAEMTVTSAIGTDAVSLRVPPRPLRESCSFRRLGSHGLAVPRLELRVQTALRRTRARKSAGKPAHSKAAEPPNPRVRPLGAAALGVRPVCVRRTGRRPDAASRAAAIHSVTNSSASRFTEWLSF
jgi:hypothetical protein